MATIEETFKISKETRFAVIGRTIADATLRGEPQAPHIAEAMRLRAEEYALIERETRFAALARQIGDAAATGRDNADLIRKLAELRKAELGPAASEELRYTRGRSIDHV